MSFLVDTDLLSFLERKRVPPKLVPWLAQHDGDLYWKKAKTETPKFLQAENESKMRGQMSVVGSQ